ncbi:MAG: hypothetical protein WCP93_01000 [Candidatus Berkelbacteria bacterium]
MFDLMNDPELKAFFDEDILKLIGGDDLAPEKKQELYLEIGKTVQNRVIARIYATLSEEEGAEFDKLIDQDEFDKVQEYLRRKNLDLPALMAAEALAYKLEVYELFKTAQAQNPSN